jgi:hypothetical protein
MGSYRLPFPEAKSYRVSHGNNDPTSHHGRTRFAFDFALPEGDIVVAAQAGIVSRLEESHIVCGDGRYADLANYVLIDHYDDNTSDLYLHIAYRSPREFGIAPGTAVRQGQPIARCGKTGWTFCQPHLHFQRQKRGQSWLQQSVPVSFVDVPGGVPLTGQWVTSANALSEEQEPGPATLLAALRENRCEEVGATYDQDAPFFRFALAHNLSGPMGPPFRRAIGENTYSVQVFARDTLYTAIAVPEENTDWEQVGRMSELLVADQDDPLGLALLEATFEAGGATFQPDWATHQYYLDQLNQRPLGAPMGQPRALEVAGHRYDVEIFALDTLYTRIPHWHEVNRLSDLLAELAEEED